jgi:hypothetical protein
LLCTRRNSTVVVFEQFLALAFELFSFMKHFFFLLEQLFLFLEQLFALVK